MKLLRTLTAATALIATLAACSNTENLPNEGDQRTALSINANISTIVPDDRGADNSVAEPSRTGSTTTRAQDTAWQPDDAIGILMLNTGTSTPTDEKTNYRYHTTDGTGAFVPTGKENIAYYPHTAALATTGSDAFVLPIDVTDQTNLAAIDLMTAPRATGHSSTQPSVDLAFSHRLCKLVLHVLTDESTADIDLSGATATIHGMTAFAKWDIIAEAMKPIITQESPTIALPMTPDGTLGTAILIPTAAGANKSITLSTADGRYNFTARIADHLALTTGTVNSYTMTLSRGNTIIDNVTILPWTEGTHIDGEGQLTDVITGGTIALPAKAPGTFHLAALEGDSRFVGLYDWDGTALKPGATEPLTWDQLINQPHTFEAAFAPNSAAAEGHEKDLLFATVTNVAFGAALNFSEMAHANAQLSLKLTSSDGTLTAEQLATAIATVNVNRTSLCNTNGTISFPEADKNVVLKNGNAILAPQTISTITLTINGKSYTITRDIKLEGGTNTEVRADIKASTINITVGVAAWKDATVDGEGQLADVITGGTIALPAKAPGTFHLAALEGDSRFVGLYDWDGTALKPGATEPLTWDQLINQPHTFEAAFAPNSAAAEGHEKDLLFATVTNVAFGAALNFSEMAHANAQLSLKLTSSDGTLTAEQLATAIATVNVNRTSLCNTNGTISFPEADKNVVLKNGNAILAPQTISTIALTINGKSYTITRNIKLEGGTNTEVKADIKGSTVSISVGVATWKKVTIDGGEIEMNPQ